MTKEDYDIIVNFYQHADLSNLSTKEIRGTLYAYIISHSDIGYKYVDGEESLEEYDNKVNKVIDKIISKYEIKSNKSN